MTRKSSKNPAPVRRDRLIKERVHDPYMMRAKLPDPTICPECQVVFTEGRWQWLPSVPTEGHQELCPACRRISDKVPAGILNLSGGFFHNHRDEIMSLLHNNVEAQMAQHAIKRVMGVEEPDDESVVVTFTDSHLPQTVGEAIRRAYQGDLDIQYTDEAGIVRASWTRD